MKSSKLQIYDKILGLSMYSLAGIYCDKRCPHEDTFPREESLALSSWGQMVFTVHEDEDFAGF